MWLQSGRRDVRRVLVLLGEMGPLLLSPLNNSLPWGDLKVSLRQICCLVLCVFLSNCKSEKAKESDTKGLYSQDVLQKKEDFDISGQCTILDHVVSGDLDVSKIFEFAKAANERVRQSEILWTAVAKARAERGSAFGGKGDSDGMVNRLQTRGYIEPVFLADIRGSIAYNGKNAMDVFQELATKSKDEAVRFGRTIRSSHSQSLKIDEAFSLAFQQAGHDPFKAMGYIGALTIWDRWNSEAQAERNKGSRNDFTVLPQLMSSVGHGDKAGQIYHFWGFVALIAANGPYLGSVLGNLSTFGYEVVRSKLQQGFVDVEDFEVDNFAVSYALGMHKILKLKPSKAAATELHGKLLCKSKLAQTVQNTDDDRRKCEIWTEFAGSMQDARSLAAELETSKPLKFIAFSDLMDCAISAKQAVGDYKDFEVKTKSGKPANFSFMRYGGATKSQRTAIFSSEWIGDGLNFARPPSFIRDYCVKANLIGGDCSSLKQVVSLDLCPKAEEFKKCTSENADAIDFYQSSLAYCLASKPKGCTARVDEVVSSDCWHANKTGGTCGNLRQVCAGRYCKLSAADFSECTKNHSLQIQTCMAMNQHCLKTELDRCIPLKDLSKYSFEVIW